MNQQNVSSEKCYNLTRNFFSQLNGSNFSAITFNPWNCTEVFIFYQTVMNFLSETDNSGGVPFSAMYIAICAPMLLLQLTTLPIFIVNHDFWKSIGLRILFVNGIGDSIQLIGYLTFAFLNILMKRISMGLQDFGGAVIIPHWSLVVIQHFLLALNRLIVILRARNPGLKFIPNEENEQRIFNIAILISWLLYLSSFAIFWSPLAGFVLDRKTMVFRFDWNQPYTHTWEYANWALTMWMPWICLFIYCFIVCTACKFRRRKDQSKTSSTNSNLNGPLLNEPERILLIQAIILYTFMATLIMSWYLIDTCTGFTNVICTARIFGIELFKIPLEWHSILIEAPWMFFCGLGPILLLGMNKEFRAHYCRFYFCKSSKAHQTNGMPTSLTNLDGINRMGEEKREKMSSNKINQLK